MFKSMVSALLVMLATFAHAATPTVVLECDSRTPAVGATVVVFFHVASAPASATWNQYLTFDKTRLALTGQAGGSTGVFVPDSRSLADINASGQVRAAGYVAGGASGTPVSGTMTMGTFTFRTLSAGTATITTAGRHSSNLSANLLIGPAPGRTLTVPDSSAVVILTIGGSGGIPVITTAPVNATVTVGQTATFTATASGTPTPTYQWQSAPAGSGSFVDIIGATAASCTTPATTLDQTGTRFRVIASNSAGSATSTEAILTIDGIAPAITSQPVDAAVIAGQTATFTASASGTPAPTFQWQSAPAVGAFTNISGATSASYTTPATTLAQNGTRYQVIATNSAGTATSSIATLTVTAAAVVVAPVITTQPTDQTVTEGQTATFSATASGSPAPTFQWQSAPAVGAFTDISGATSASYTTPATTLAQNGSRYQVIATNSAGTATSSIATLTVTAAAIVVAPVITTQPTDQAVTQGQTATFIASASGSPAPTFQWQSASAAGAFSDIVGATAASYTTPAASMAQNGMQFRLIATNRAGSATSTIATLSVTGIIPPPAGDGGGGGGGGKKCGLGGGLALAGLVFALVGCGRRTRRNR